MVEQFLQTAIGHDEICVEEYKPVIRHRRSPLLEPAVASRSDEWRRDYFPDAWCFSQRLRPATRSLFLHCVPSPDSIRRPA
jgi:hypothetical protein